MALKAGAAISIVAFIIFQLAPRPIVAIFGTGSEAYFEFGERFIRIYLFGICINFMQPISATFFTSIGKAYKGLFLSLTRQIIFLLPLILVLPIFFGIDGLLFAGPVADTLSFICAIIMVAIEFRAIKKLETSANVGNVA